MAHTLDRGEVARVTSIKAIKWAICALGTLGVIAFVFYEQSVPGKVSELSIVGIKLRHLPLGPGWALWILSSAYLLHYCQHLRRLSELGPYSNEEPWMPLACPFESDALWKHPHGLDRFTHLFEVWVSRIEYLALLCVPIAILVWDGMETGFGLHVPIILLTAFPTTYSILWSGCVMVRTSNS